MSVRNILSNIITMSYFDGYAHAVADLRGHQGCASPLPGPISFIFMQFSGKNWPNNRVLAQPLGLAPHCLRNSESTTVMCEQTC